MKQETRVFLERLNVRRPMQIALEMEMLLAYQEYEDLKAGRLKIVLPSFSSITDGIYVTYPSRQHLPAKVRVFLDYVVEKLTPRPPWAIPKN